MINSTLYFREMKKSIKVLLVFFAVITMYVSIIIGMYDPKMMETLDNFYKIMPEVMSAVGMSKGATSLLGFMVSYLYGFILVIFPMIFCIICGNGLVAKYTDSGAMAVLIGAPVKRKKVVITQLMVLVTGVIVLVLYSTLLEILIAAVNFPGELNIGSLVKLNVGLLFLILFTASICFCASCFFSETKYSLAFGAGIPILMYVLQMLSNVGEKTKNIKYLTYFTLFDANGIIAGNSDAFLGTFILLTGAIALFVTSVGIFCKKDLCL